MNETVKTDHKDEEKAVEERLAPIKHILLVLSGKGGVGKSTVAVNVATELAREGYRVGLLDIDIHGPSLPVMLGLEGTPIHYSENAMLPVEFTINLSVMSIGFLLKDRGDAVIWRGPMKYGVIKQFISDVEWGELDYLVVDSPPGTGDEPLSIAQLTGKKSRALIVTTPQRVSIDDVRKSINFCKKLELPVAGIIENMSGFVCPHCGERVDIFDTGGGEKLAKEMNVPFLARIPIEPGIVDACDNGGPYVLTNGGSETAKAFRTAIEFILASQDEK
ncbi:MAG: Mrp/NBP35 family ATP-binding protein [Candidatus Latescibacteria bacterium]|nr:Mrp/NBP35 family ATP-binding protein [Candidatus Latescibacterota bacterium]